VPLIPNLHDLELPPSPPVPIVGDGVIRDVCAARYATQERPPRLTAALARAARARDVDDVEALDYAYRELAVAAMVNLSRLRAAYPELVKT
jgi:hypothetical protein